MKMLNWLILQSVGVLTQSLLAPHAKTYQLQKGTPPELPESVQDSSGMSYEPFAWWDDQDCCWKTWQNSLQGEWEPFSGRWPRSGMTRSGRVYRLVPWVRPTGEIESGS